MVSSACYAQDEKAIIDSALAIYQRNLPVWQKNVFKTFCRLYKTEKVRMKDFDKYQIIVTPTYKTNELCENYTGEKSIVNYIDFTQIVRWSYGGDIFRDEKFLGNCDFFVNKLRSWRSLVTDVDTYINFAQTIKDFNPDMAFCVCGFWCAIKDGKVYIARETLVSPSDTIPFVFEYKFLEESEYMNLYGIKPPMYQYGIKFKYSHASYPSNYQKLK